MPATSTRARTQSDRSSEMREKLIAATIQSLIDKGYARTTAVEVCARAGVTRGALFHHFESLPALIAVALSDTYDRLLLDDQPDETATTIEDWVVWGWSRVSQREFKAVIEIWLASRNDPESTAAIRPAMERYKEIFTPSEDNRLFKRFGTDKKAAAFYRLAIETMFGLALGRAANPDGAALDHEGVVLDQLRAYAREIDRQ
ncbi:MAG: TetR/AcrR family transcriptional regulator [Rhodobiaceae bacterium]|nr:TetR/AcrR family transcriptional regulator [Rhodobiaceae bacterium]